MKLAAGKEWAPSYAKDGGLPAACTRRLWPSCTSDPAQAPFAAAFARPRASRTAPTGPRPTRPRRCCRTRPGSVIEGKAAADDALAKANKELEEILNQ